MSFIKKYKKDVKDLTNTNMAFDGIKKNLDFNNNKAKNNKKIVWSSVFGGGVLVAASVVVGMVIINSTKPISPIIPSSGDTPSSSVSGELVPSDNKLSFKAVAKSATPLLTYSLAESIDEPSFTRAINAAIVTATEDDEAIIQELLYQFDTIIQNDNNYVVEAQESDREEYKYKEVITFKDLLNQDNSYSLYYNDVKVEEEIDDDEIEKETTYVGLAVKDDKEFNFRLELEEENETGETEVESTFYLFEKDDRYSYTKVSSSSEVEGLESETEYSYEVVKNGQLVTSYEMEIEFDETENEVELNLELNEKEYLIERKFINEDTYFHVEFENDETEEESEWVYKKVIDGDNVSYIIVG